MKICISSTGKDLGAKMDLRFGRCRNFIFVDLGSFETEAISNPGATAGGGAGTKAAQLVSDKRAEVVLTGNVGPKAYSVLEAAGIKVYTGLSGTCKEALDLFNTGSVSTINGPTVEGHNGLR